MYYLSKLNKYFINSTTQSLKCFECDVLNCYYSQFSLNERNGSLIITVKLYCLVAILYYRK